VLLGLKSDGKLRSYKSLNILYLVRTLVQYCKVRDLKWDPREDILFMCRHYSAEVQSMRAQLDQKAVQEHFLGTPFLASLSPEDQRRCYRILLGTDPPPAMAITPPPPVQKRLASAANSTARLSIPSYRSTPSLNAENLSELLCPPHLGKPESSGLPTANSGSRPLGLPAPSNLPTRINSEVEAMSQNARSRYRPSSVPNGRDISPIDARPTSLRSTHAEKTPPPAKPIQTTPIPSSQQHSVQQLPYPAHLSPAPVGVQCVRSMPNFLRSGAVTAVAPETFAQTPSPAFSQHTQPYTSPLEISARPVSLVPGQWYMTPQVEGSGHVSSQQQYQTRSVQLAERPVNQQVRSSYQKQQTVRAELLGTPIPMTQVKELQVVNSTAPTVIEPRKTSAILPSHHIQPVVPRISDEAIATSISPARFAQSNGSYATQIPLLPVELDAVSQFGHLIAELPVDRATPVSSHRFGQVKHQHPRVRHTSDIQRLSISHSAPTYTDSPLTSPESMYTENMVVEPLNPRARSVALPPSLIAGAYAHQRAHSSTPPHRHQQIPTPQTNTNASKYTVTKSQTSPFSPQTIHLATATYKAYQPPSQHSPTDSMYSPDKPRTLGALKDVDGAGGYFSHKREGGVSDAERLAEEYQREMPWVEGYGSPGWV
jgi:hypothetical protein